MIITLLVIACIGGTCYIFFKNYQEKISAPVSCVSMVKSESSVEFRTSLNEVGILTNNSGSDDRFVLVINTLSDLDNMLMSLANYYIDEDFTVRDKDIRAKYNQMEDSKALAVEMINQYKLKSNSVWFDRSLGANDLYTTMSTYIVKYAEFVELLNLKVANKEVNRTSDFKFSMIDLYARVARVTFATLKTNEQSLRIVNSSENITRLQIYFQMENSYIVGGDVYSANALHFSENYFACDKESFAINFASNLNAVDGISATSTNLQRAVYYYKLVYGI